MQHLSLDVQAG